MHKVMIRCPITGEPVWTGVTMTPEMLGEHADDAILNFRCPACDELHAWTRADAWLDAD